MLHGYGDSDSYIRRFHEAFPHREPLQPISLFLTGKFATLNRFVLVIYVGGGSSANLLVVWRLHGLDRGLRAAWKAGVVMAGINDGLGFVHGA
jgi:peptidase E